MTQIMCVGHAVEDYVFRMGAIPTEARKHQADEFTTVGGGPAANAAVAIARLGGDVRLAARLGDDAVAASIEADLEREGVDCAGLRRFAGCRSSLSAVMVDDDGQRMIVNYLDASLPQSGDWVADVAPETVAAVLVDVRWPDGGAAGLKLARARGVPGVLDADHPIPAGGALFADASHIAFSADGLRRYLQTEDLGAGVQRVARETGAWCCVTDGENGVAISARGDDLDHAPSLPVRAVDTLGAGDVWHGAFALRLAEGASELEAVRFASAAAAIKVTRPGGRAGAPQRSEVDEALAANTTSIRRESVQ
ncbi:MAG: PfkB family carbohydrate kinase [Pseudomonadota bacterium]